MKESNYYNFIIGVLLFIFYEKSFYFIHSLNELLLFSIKSSETLYIIGFIISIVITDVLIAFLYKVYFKNDRYKRCVLQLLIVVVIVVLLSFGANYYLGYFGRIGVDKRLQDIFYKYYDYKDVVYLINTTVLIALYLSKYLRKSYNE